MPDAKRVVALLLVPLPGDGGGGLVKTWRPQGNGRPPMVWKGPMGWNSGPPYLQHSALPLWWNGELVGMGWDVARRFFLEHVDPSGLVSDHDLESILQDRSPSLHQCRIVAEQMFNLGFVAQ